MFIVVVGGDFQMGGGFRTMSGAYAWAALTIGSWLKYEVIAQ